MVSACSKPRQCCGRNSLAATRHHAPVAHARIELEQERYFLGYQCGHHSRCIGAVALVFSKRMIRKRKAYIKRNRQLPRLLSSTTRGRGDENGEVVRSALVLSSRRLLFPALFLGANDAVTMAPTHVLMGMFATSAVTGQDGGILRLAPASEATAQE